MTTPKAKFAGLAIIAVLCYGFTLGLTAPAWAGFDEGVAAFNRGDYATALREWRPLAEQGHAKAQFNLGLMYNNGHGVPKNYPRAVKWFRKAAVRGHARAQHSLGFIYLTGRGVPNDNAEAVKWFRKAAEQGVAEAQYNLGFMYRKGHGVPQDWVRAYVWYDLAASRLPPGKLFDRAVEHRDLVAAEMTPAQIVEADNLAREWRPK